MRQAFIGAAVLVAVAAGPASAASFQQEFPRAKADVLQAFAETLPASGFKIGERDDGLARITAASGITWAGSGENLSLSVSDAGAGRSLVNITVTMRRGFQDPARLQLVADKVIGATSKRLQQAPIQAPRP